jgi:hypothetical protein
MDIDDTYTDNMFFASIGTTIGTTIAKVYLDGMRATNTLDVYKKNFRFSTGILVDQDLKLGFKMSYLEYTEYGMKEKSSNLSGEFFIVAKFGLKNKIK